jgi:hypothetical protein
MVIQIAQGGALIGLAGGVLPRGPSLSIFLTPWAMGKVLTRPSAIRWLTEGIGLSSSTKHGIAVSARLAREVLLATDGKGIEYIPGDDYYPTP